MIFLLAFNILLTKSRKLTHDCNKECFDFDDYLIEPYDYSISCTNNKILYINLSYPKKESKLSISQASNVFITCSQFHQQINTLNLSIYGTPNITFQNVCYFGNIEINGDPIFNFLSHSHIYGENLILKNFKNHFFADYISFKISSNTTKNKNIKSESSLLDINNLTLECNNYEMKIILSQNANIICGSYFDILLEYEYFSRTHFYVHDNYVNFQQTDFNAVPYMKNIFLSLHFDDETNVIFTDYLIYEIDNYIEMFDQKKLNIARTMLYRDDPDYTPLNMHKKNTKYVNTIPWRKARINGQMYYYGYTGSNDDIIEITPSMKRIIILVIFLVIIFLMLSYCFVAQCRFYALS